MRRRKLLPRSVLQMISFALCSGATQYQAALLLCYGYLFMLLFLPNVRMTHICWLRHKVLVHTDAFDCDEGACFVFATQGTHNRNWLSPRLWETGPTGWVLVVWSVNALKSFELHYLVVVFSFLAAFHLPLMCCKVSTTCSTPGRLSILDIAATNVKLAARPRRVTRVTWVSVLLGVRLF